MPTGTTSKDRPTTVAPPPVVSIERARAAWATASRDSELDRWREMYDLAVPRPRRVIETVTVDASSVSGDIDITATTGVLRPDVRARSVWGHVPTH